jgi:hypothetical protein
LTKARDLANASTALSAVSATELAFVDGVTSAIQTQIDAKAPSSTAVTLTGTQTLTNKTLTNPVISSVINNTLTSTTGDIIYASAANTPARLGIGTTGQVLNVASGVPAWATPASGGGMTLLSTTTLSGAGVTISSISQDYVNLFITITRVTDNGNGTLRFLPNGLTDCDDIGLELVDSTSSIKSSQNGEIRLTTTYNLNYNSANNAWAMVIPNYALTNTRKIFQWYGTYIAIDNQVVINNASSANNANSAITSISVNNPGATFTGGTVRIYGVK